MTKSAQDIQKKTAAAVIVEAAIANLLRR